MARDDHSMRGHRGISFKLAVSHLEIYANRLWKTSEPDRVDVVFGRIWLHSLELAHRLNSTTVADVLAGINFYDQKSRSLTMTPPFPSFTELICDDPNSTATTSKLTDVWSSGCRPQTAQQTDSTLLAGCRSQGCYGESCSSKHIKIDENCSDSNQYISSEHFSTAGSENLIAYNNPFHLRLPFDAASKWPLISNSSRIGRKTDDSQKCGVEQRCHSRVPVEYNVASLFEQHVALYQLMLINLGSRTSSVPVLLKIPKSPASNRTNSSHTEEKLVSAISAIDIDHQHCKNGRRTKLGSDAFYESKPSAHADQTLSGSNCSSFNTSYDSPRSSNLKYSFPGCLSQSDVVMLIRVPVDLSESDPGLLRLLSAIHSDQVRLLWMIPAPSPVGLRSASAAGNASAIERPPTLFYQSAPTDDRCRSCPGPVRRPLSVPWRLRHLLAKFALKSNLSSATSRRFRASHSARHCPAAKTVCSTHISGQVESFDHSKPSTVVTKTACIANVSHCSKTSTTPANAQTESQLTTTTTGSSGAAVNPLIKYRRRKKNDVNVKNTAIVMTVPPIVAQSYSGRSKQPPRQRAFSRKSPVPAANCSSTAATNSLASRHQRLWLHEQVRLSKTARNSLQNVMRSTAAYVTTGSIGEKSGDQRSLNKNLPPSNERTLLAKQSLADVQGIVSGTVAETKASAPCVSAAGDVVMGNLRRSLSDSDLSRLVNERRQIPVVTTNAVQLVKPATGDKRVRIGCSSTLAQSTLSSLTCATLDSQTALSHGVSHDGIDNELRINSQPSGNKKPGAVHGSNLPLNASAASDDCNNDDLVSIPTYGTGGDRFVVQGAVAASGGYPSHSLTHWAPIQLTSRSVVIQRGPSSRLKSSMPVQFGLGSTVTPHPMAAGDPAVPVMLHQTHQVAADVGNFRPTAASVRHPQHVAPWSVVRLKLHPGPASVKPVLAVAAAGTCPSNPRALSVATSAPQHRYVVDTNSPAPFSTNQWSLPLTSLATGQKVEVIGQLVENPSTRLIAAETIHPFNPGGNTSNLKLMYVVQSRSPLLVQRQQSAKLVSSQPYGYLVDGAMITSLGQSSGPFMLRPADRLPFHAGYGASPTNGAECGMDSTSATGPIYQQTAAVVGMLATPSYMATNALPIIEVDQVLAPRMLPATSVMVAAGRKTDGLWVAAGSLSSSGPAAAAAAGAGMGTGTNYRMASSNAFTTRSFTSSSSVASNEAR